MPVLRKLAVHLYFTVDKFEQWTPSCDRNVGPCLLPMEGAEPAAVPCSWRSAEQPLLHLVQRSWVRYLLRSSWDVKGNIKQLDMKGLCWMPCLCSACLPQLGIEPHLLLSFLSPGKVQVPQHTEMGYLPMRVGQWGLHFFFQIMKDFL